MASNLYLMRGLPIRDCTFSDYANSWTGAGAFSGMANTRTAPPPTPRTGVSDADISSYQFGAGHSLMVDIDACAGSDDYLYSGFTPRGVACGPMDTGRNLVLWIGMIVRTVGPGASNTAALAKVAVLQYDEDGTLLVTGTNADFTNTANPSGLVRATSWQLVTSTPTAALNANCRYFKLRLLIADHNNGTDPAWLNIDWIGVGIPFSAGAGYDALTGWYGPAPTHSGRSPVVHISPWGTVDPYIRVSRLGGKPQSLALNFSDLSETDKRHVEACHHWTCGSGAAGASSLYDANIYAENRGSSLPVVVVPNRETTKFAMYADFDEPQWTQSIQGMWPDSGARWNTSITFNERLC